MAIHKSENGWAIDTPHSDLCIDFYPVSSQEDGQGILIDAGYNSLVIHLDEVDETIECLKRVKAEIESGTTPRLETVGEKFKRRDPEIVQELADIGEIASIKEHGGCYAWLPSVSGIATVIKNVPYGTLFEVPNKSIKKLGIQTAKNLKKGVAFLTKAEMEKLYNKTEK
jgi:hypothetical protein